MRIWTLAFICLSLLFAAACGGGGSTPTSTTTTTTTTTSTPTFPSIVGNYNLTASSQTSTAVSFIGGSISNAAGVITGVVHIDSSSCYSVLTDVPITGTVTSAGAMTLTTASVASQVATVSATMSADGSTITAGTYTVTGGCANGDHGTIAGFRMQSFSATYSGTVTSVSGPVTPVGAVLTQSTTADSHGFFQLTGTATITGSPCFTTATVTNSMVAGEAFLLNLQTNTPGTTISFLGIATDATTKTVNGSYSVSGGACNGDNGNGVLTHP